jgi:DNA-binding MarR family transcriptional regulator
MTPSAEPRWLTDEERAAWLAVAAIIFTLPGALDARLQQDADLTFFDYMVLSVLSERTDRTMQMSEIAAGVSASLSRLSHVAAKLEGRGLLRRERVEGAGRRTSATLTDQGHATVVAAAADHVAAVREYVMDVMQPADLATLSRIGVDIAGRINPARPFIHGVSPGGGPTANERPSNI